MSWTYNELITAVRESFTDVHSATPVEQIVSRSRVIRARRRIPGAVAAAAVVVTLVPGHGDSGAPTAFPSAGTSLTARLVADQAAAAALSPPAIRPSQWIYRKTMWENTESSRQIRTQVTWQTADGSKTDMGGGAGMTVISSGPDVVTYADVSKLPWDPKELDAYFAHLDYPNPDATAANKEVPPSSTSRNCSTRTCSPRPAKRSCTGRWGTSPR